MARITDMRVRRGTAALWASTNSVLSVGEPGLETDTNRLKFGDGTKAWNSLPYFKGGIDPLETVAENVAMEVEWDVNNISAPLGQRLVIPTHISPAGGQTTHPAVLFFPEGWNGWRYWMAHTPYPAGNDDHEDPNIVVSNNGINWQAPPGLTNPLDDADGTPEYNSDVDLKMGPNNTMYLFWRFYDPNSIGSEEKLYYRSSTDGVNWTAKTLHWTNNETVRRPVSPTLVYEDNGWTMWYVDITPSPNVVMRTRSTGVSVTSGWATPTTLTGVTSQSGKEPWHIYMLRLGGKYYGLLNDCTIDASGADGDLLFMQSYDGKAFEVGTSSIIPRSWAGEHDRLYRSTMVPAFEDGKFGFRVWYVGWLAGPPSVWNVYRTFLTATPAPVPGGPAEYAPLSPTGFSNRGRIMVEDAGLYMKYTLDITIMKNATGTIAMSTAFASLGVVIPTALRTTTATNNVRYWTVWLYGAFNIVGNLFINFNSGEALARLQSGTATMSNNTTMDLMTTIYIPKSELP